MPDAPGLELIANAVREKVSPDAVVGTSHFREQACLEVAPGSVRDVLEFLKTSDAHAFNFLCSVHGCDYLPEAPRLGVHYELMNMRRVERLRVIDASVMPLITSANTNATSLMIGEKGAAAVLSSANGSADAS